MDFAALLQVFAASGHEIQQIGVPTVFLMFNFWILHQERARSDTRLSAELARTELEEKRTEAERHRVDELQGKLFALAQASIEQSLKTEAAVLSLQKELHDGAQRPHL